MEKWLIDASALFEFLKEQREKETGSYSKGRNNGINVAIGAIRNKQICPTVDAVEVVRCKDCAVPHNKWTGCPKLNGLVPPSDFYCAYGERREGE